MTTGRINQVTILGIHNERSTLCFILFSFRKEENSTNFQEATLTSRASIGNQEFNSFSTPKTKKKQFFLLLSSLEKPKIPPGRKFARGLFCNPPHKRGITRGVSCQAHAQVLLKTSTHVGTHTSQGHIVNICSSSKVYQKYREKLPFQDESCDANSSYSEVSRTHLLALEYTTQSFSGSST